MTAKPPKSNAARRQFLFDSAKMVCGVGMLGLGLGLYAKQSKALPALALRPPGALPENDFLGACIRCGLCVRDCPYNTLELAKPEAPVATGTPFFNARNIPCEMCDDIPCVKACPTKALDHGLTDINKAKMGVAVLIDHETCLNFLGLRCDVCYRVCPVIDKAITLDMQPNQRTGRHAMFLPTVHSEHCTGCGKCEMTCGSTWSFRSASRSRKSGRPNCSTRTRNTRARPCTTCSTPTARSTSSGWMKWPR